MISIWSWFLLFLSLSSLPGGTVGHFPHSFFFLWPLFMWFRFCIYIFVLIPDNCLPLKKLQYVTFQVIIFGGLYWSDLDSAYSLPENWASFHMAYIHLLHISKQLLIWQQWRQKTTTKSTIIWSCFLKKKGILILLNQCSVPSEDRSIQ